MQVPPRSAFLGWLVKKILVFIDLTLYATTVYNTKMTPKQINLYIHFKSVVCIMFVSAVVSISHVCPCVS